MVSLEKFLATQAYPETLVSCRRREFRASLDIPDLSPKASVFGRTLGALEELESVWFVGRVKERTETVISW